MGGKTALETIESLGPVSAATFKSKAKLEFVEDLMVSGLTKSGRKELASVTGTGFSEHQIIQWCNRADLMRIKGVGEEYSDLLEAAGVDTVVELKHRVAENLVKNVPRIVAHLHASPAGLVSGFLCDLPNRRGLISGVNPLYAVLNVKEVAVAIEPYGTPRFGTPLSALGEPGHDTWQSPVHSHPTSP